MNKGKYLKLYLILETVVGAVAFGVVMDNVLWAIVFSSAAGIFSEAVMALRGQRAE